MILKLFKYDFMNIGKKLIPFYIAALVIGIINRFLLLTTDISRMERENNFLYDSICHNHEIQLFNIRKWRISYKYSPIKTITDNMGKTDKFSYMDIYKLLCYICFNVYPLSIWIFYKKYYQRYWILSGLEYYG